MPMSQGQTAPLSIRLGEERLARVDAYAAERGLKRHAALMDLIDAGLDKKSTPPETLLNHMRRVAVVSRDLEIEPDVAAHIERLREVHDRPYVHVGPKAYKPGDLAKRGKGK